MFIRWEDIQELLTPGANVNGTSPFQRLIELFLIEWDDVPCIVPPWYHKLHPIAPIEGLPGSAGVINDPAASFKHAVHGPILQIRDNSSHCDTVVMTFFKDIH